jgi:predicted NAD/FAD-binding protein
LYERHNNTSEKEHLRVALVVPRTNDKNVKIVMASSPLGNNNDDFNNENESSKKKQTVCVIGAGISGLSAAYLLHQSNAFAVTVYESEPTAGGHALTREKSKHAGELDVDLGFQVFNLTTYPHLVGLFEELRVKHEQSDMSFSLQSERTEWGSLGLSGIFAQKRNLINPKFWNMIREILKFKKVKHDVLSGSKKEYWETKTLGEYLRENGYSDYFRDHYVLPMCAAIWSCNDKDALGFPLKPLITFWANHHLLEIFERPVWRVVKGRSKAYVEAVLKALPDGCVKTGRYVHTVHRYFDDASKSRIKVKTTETKKAATGEQTKEKFDHVIFACHAHQALAMIGKNATEKELEILSNFRTTRNEVVLHDDPQFMPKNRSAWASWNCKSIGKKGENDSVCVTYWVNLLQNLPKGAKDVFVTLNPTEKIDEERVEFKKYLGHPVFNENAIKAQEDLKSRLQGENNTWFTGAWLRYGFHEDGIHSAVEMCKEHL